MSTENEKVLRASVPSRPDSSREDMLRLHPNLVEATRRLSVGVLKHSVFYRLVEISKEEVFHAACEAARQERKNAERTADVKQDEIIAAALEAGIDIGKG